MNDKITLNIEIDLNRLISGAYGPISQDSDGELSTGPTTIEAIIADLASRQLVKELAWEDKSELRRRISELRDEEIRKHVEPMVLETILEPVQRTNSWGEPQGEAKELRDLIVERAKEQLHVKRSSSGALDVHRGKTLLESVIDAEVTRVFEAELRTAVKEQKAAALAAIREKAAEVMAATIDELARGK